jgi:PAS domain S-box-containing protein
MRVFPEAKITSRPGPRAFLALLAVLPWLLVCPFAAAAGTGKPRLVVVLYPENNDGSPGNTLVNQNIRSTFVASSREPVQIYDEYLDLSPPRDPGHRQIQIEYLRRKYAGRKIDLVIAGLSSGLDFALKYREAIFPRVPIVFCAVDEEEIKARRLPADVIGTPLRFDLTATLDLALRLQPKTRRVVVIAGSAPMDAFWAAQARRAFRAYEMRLEVVYLAGLPLPDLLKQVANLPKRSIVYYIHVFRDGAGKALSPAFVLEQLAQVANAPIYGHVDTYVGRGAVGGRVIRFETEGENAAKVGLRILAGEKPEQIGVQPTTENTPLFDWRQLRRWGIREESLPPGSVVRFENPSFWDLYKWEIIGVSSLCLVQALLIAGLLVQRTNRRQAENRFRQTIEAAPNGMVIVGKDGTIVLANAQMEKLFGYAKEEMLGQPVEMLVPRKVRDQHRADRRRFFATPQARPMGPGRDLFGQRKDGSQFPVEIGLSPVQTDAGPLVLASIIDITERKQAEEGLRASQSELRVLTGRLLQAQETERRRIARELHDDLNQDLALLAVEMEILGQKLPGAAAPLHGHLQALSARVKELSSSVHDLSHQLHPSKLEQLGLLVTVRALCKELTQNHGLPIEFIHHEVPEALPEDTALCLYRIVQEALRNVIKHSEARQAEVELSGGADTLCLRIVDDGTGFDLRAADHGGGLGLVSMRERLRLVGGEMAIDSRPSAGTRIEVRVPVDAAGPASSPLRAQPANIG